MLTTSKIKTLLEPVVTDNSVSKTSPMISYVVQQVSAITIGTARFGATSCQIKIRFSFDIYQTTVDKYILFIRIPGTANQQPTIASWTKLEFERLTMADIKRTLYESGHVTSVEFIDEAKHCTDTLLSYYKIKR